MKSNFLAITATIATLATPMAQAQTVETDPVGFTKETFASGSTIVSTNLLNSKITQSAISSVNAGADLPGDPVTPTTEITSADVNWTSDAFNEGADFPTHYAQVVEDPNGNLKGLIMDIFSNTDETLRVVGNYTSQPIAENNLDGDETILVRSHLTLGQLFSGANDLLAFVDSVKFFEQGGARSTYLWTGSGFTGNGNLRPIYPGQAFLLTSTTPTVVTVVGDVPVEDTLVPLYSGTVNFVSLIDPSPDEETTLQNLNIGKNMLGFVDSVTIYSKDGNLQPIATYLWQGSALGWSGDGNSFQITNEHALLVSVVSNQTWLAPKAFENN